MLQTEHFEWKDHRYDEIAEELAECGFYISLFWWSRSTRWSAELQVVSRGKSAQGVPAILVDLSENQKSGSDHVRGRWLAAEQGR